MKVVNRKRLKFKDGYTYLNRNMIMDEHPEHIHKSLLEYFKKEDLHQYSDMWKTYDVLSEYLSVDKEQLLITRGVEGAIKQAFETLITEGDSVGILTPTFAMYKVYAEVYGIDVIEIEFEYKRDNSITVEHIKEIVPDIKVLFLDNPKLHLPNYFTHEELDTIIKYCEKQEVIVFLDEVYVGLEVDSYLPNLNKHNNLVISSGFSKMTFPSIKTGWLVTNKDLKEKIESLRESYELNYFACKSIEFIIDNQDYIKDLKNRILDIKKRWYNKLLKSNKFKVFDSKSYVLRLYSEDKDLVRRTYDNLYSEKIVVNIVEDKNLVFSVINNKKIEDKFFDDKIGIFQEFDKERYENGQRKSEGDLKNGKRDGLWIWYYENGQKKEEVTYSEGKKTGDWIQWDKNGQKIKIVRIYHEDDYYEEPEIETFFDQTEKEPPEDGVFRKYWKNGNKRYEWEYKDGKRVDGKSIGWWPNGQLKQINTWKNGKENGLYTWYGENGQKAGEVPMKDNIEHGKWTRWYPQTGTKRGEGMLKNGKLDGPVTWYDENDERNKYEITYTTEKLNKIGRGTDPQHDHRRVWFDTPYYEYIRDFPGDKILNDE